MKMLANKPLLYGVVIPSVVIVVVAGITLLLGSDIGRRADAIRSSEQELSSRAQAVEALAYLRADKDRAQKYSNVLENILPTKDQLIGFPREFDAVAKKYSVRLATAFGAEEKGTDVKPGSIEFVFTAEGSLQNLLAFMKAAESGRYILEWTSFEFLRSSGGYSATMAGRVFSR